MKLSKLYLMESDEEAIRLDVKTDVDAVKEQAKWCGIGPGANVLDIGCGSGKTTSVLYELVQPGGSILGIDFCEDRVNYAKKNFGNKKGIEFQVEDFSNPLDHHGKYDFVWVRFILEYFRKESAELVKNFTSCLKDDGYLCLLDLDYNCLSHYQITIEMEKIMNKIISKMESDYNFDPFIGRKLYSLLYGERYQDIQLNLIAHHLIYGEISFKDNFNWIKKMEMASIKASSVFDKYNGGYKAFFSDFKKFFNDPGRFTYTPMIMCKGRKP